MLKLCVFSLIFVFNSQLLWATTFNPTPIEDQLESAYGVLHGTFVDQSYKKIQTGEVVTIANFKVLGSSGLGNNEILNKNSFGIMFPGGKWQGLVYKVFGAPVFQKDEEVILLVSKQSFGFVLNNLSMGKYLVMREDNETYIKSSVFPKHPELGKVSIESLNVMLNARFGQPLEDIHHDKYVDKSIQNNEFVNKKTNRYDRIPASKKLASSKNKVGEFSIFWVILVLAGLGGASAVLLKRNS